MAQQGEEGFGWINDSISNHCHLKGMFDGGCGNCGGGDVMINVMMAVAVEAAMERGRRARPWGKPATTDPPRWAPPGAPRIKPYHPFCLWAEYYT